MHFTSKIQQLNSTNPVEEKRTSEPEKVWIAMKGRHIAAARIQGKTKAAMKPLVKPIVPRWSKSITRYPRPR